MPKRGRRKIPKRQNTGVKEVILFEETYFNDESLRPVKLDGSAYYEAIRKKEKGEETAWLTDIKPSTSRSKVPKMEHTEEVLSNSLQALLKEINDAESEELVIEGISKENIPKRDGQFFNAYTEGGDKNSLCDSTTGVLKKNNLDFLHALHSSSSYNSSRSLTKENSGDNRSLGTASWVEMLHSSSKSDVISLVSRSAEDQNKVCGTNSNSSIEPFVTHQFRLTDECFDKCKPVLTSEKNSLPEQGQGILCSVAKSRKTSLTCHSEEPEEWRKSSDIIDGNWRGILSRKSSLQKRRRSEKSGLIKIVQVLADVNEAQLQPITESPENSIVELADDLANISFDPIHISTPLQRVFKTIDKNARRIKRSKEEDLEHERMMLDTVLRKKDRSVQTHAILRDLSMTHINVTSYSKEDSTNQTHLSYIPCSTKDALKMNETLLPDFEKKLLDFCQQVSIVTWTYVQKKFQLDFSDAVKLGEGSFGEVFKCSLKGQQIALKVVPIEGNYEINGEKQKTYADMVPEVIVSDLLQTLNQGCGSVTSGFIRFPGAFVVKGRYPAKLLKAWDNYDGEKINESPQNFRNSQKYVLLAYEVGGKDLENFDLDNIHQAYSIVYQAAYALAIAEKTLEFEHRDLHCGNILVNKCAAEFIEERLDGTLVNVKTHGVEVKLIDFTLSRLREGDRIIYYDLKEDEEIFMGNGPLHCDYYRKMREVTGDDWKKFTPVTNALWINYVVVFLFNVLNRNSTGTYEERKKFLSHFKGLDSGLQLSSFLKSGRGRLLNVIDP